MKVGHLIVRLDEQEKQKAMYVCKNEYNTTISKVIRNVITAINTDNFEMQTKTIIRKKRKKK